MKLLRAICSVLLGVTMFFCIACNSNKPTDNSSTESSSLKTSEINSTVAPSNTTSDGTVSKTENNQNNADKSGTSSISSPNNSNKNNIANEVTKPPHNSGNTVTKNNVAENSFTEETKAEDMIDFVINIPALREPKILHLTDTQIIDSSQKRTSDRLVPILNSYWAADKKNERCYDYLTEIINAVSPDLILITGDLVYGEFDDRGSSLIELIDFFDSFNIPWAPVFGNHETESTRGADWQCEQLENSKNCLFLQRKLSGNGNYTVGIKQGDTLTRVFFMLDSNGGSNASSQSLANGHTKTSVGFKADQINWYTNLATKIKGKSPITKISMAFHIQLAVFADAFSTYGTDGSEHIYIDLLQNKPAGDFGYIGAKLKSSWDKDKKIWNDFKQLGVDSIFVGHEHANSASIVYEGIRLQYGMKCSTYDRLNYISSTGEIKSTYHSDGTPWVGGSHFKLAADGTIKDAGIYYCKNADGNIKW